MGNFQANRRMDLTIYFRENPVPLQIKNVRNMLTEGGLLRIITADEEVQWWPLSAIFNIRQDGRYDASLRPDPPGMSFEELFQEAGELSPR